jgi:NAD(P)-dependent dehydrogenase (short-subunit alcohol dehydrogenase family)
LHRFYGSLCPECAALNWAKRTQTANLAGRVAVVTGARVKIGYRIALKLLRCGAAVVATTRFPVDCARRFNLEPDAGEWRDRLTVVAMDLRDLPGLERLCARLAATLPRLDAIVNNACQTVRRPPAYYRHLLRAEAEGARARARGDDDGAVAHRDDAFAAMGTSALLAGVADAIPADPADPVDPVDPADPADPRASLDVRRNRLEAEFRDSAGATGWLSPSAAASQLAVLPSDAETSSSAAEASARLFPRGALDVNEQQIDLRVKTSWTSKLGEVETPELLEVLAVNAAAPFVLNGKLRALMAATATSLGAPAEADAADRARAPNRGFIINVSAMEGKFYRYKTPNHPHTNMAKAALNMMTATSAADYKNDNVYMNAVDTGWINDENPRHVAARIAKEHEFQTPIDEEDAAARCVAPILEGVRDAAEPPFGKFFKDYRESEW